MDSTVRVIAYEPGFARQVTDIFTGTIRSVNRADYTDQEIDAWAPLPVDYARWEERLARKQPLLAVEGDQVLGFAELEDDGHIDCLYVHAEHQRRGVGRALMQAVLERARASGLRRLYAEASITARPFFAAQGFRTVRPNLVVRRGMQLKNYIMELELAPAEAEVRSC